MIDEILDTNSLGNRSQIEYILDVAEGGTHTLSSLMEACYARSYGFRESFDALVALLVATNYLSIEDGRVQLRQPPPARSRDQFVNIFCGRLFHALADQGCLHHLFNSETISVDSRDQLIHFRNNRLPLKYAPLRNLLLSLGLLIRDSRLHNVFVVADDHHDWFRDGLIEWTTDSETAKGVTLDQLKKRLQNQENAGRIAEEYVVEYEKRRLSAHPRVDRVRMISDLNVGAGYDIISFVDADSAVVDRYIEVKSYRGEPSFYWSSNEVRVAKKKGQAYVLCLVNLDEINAPDYCPLFIQNPARSMFSAMNWLHSCEKFFFIRT